MLSSICSSLERYSFSSSGILAVGKNVHIFLRILFPVRHLKFPVLILAELVVLIHIDKGVVVIGQVAVPVLDEAFRSGSGTIISRGLGNTVTLVGNWNVQQLATSREQVDGGDQRVRFRAGSAGRTDQERRLDEAVVEKGPFSQVPWSPINSPWSERKTITVLSSSPVSSSAESIFPMPWSMRSTIA